LKKPVEIVIASGKGGTGKTTLSSFLISFLAPRTKLIGVDADVEAPDLAIALGGGRQILREEIFDSMIAEVDFNKCDMCGDCFNICQFRAIEWRDGPKIISQMCEGCGACSIVCNKNAISLRTVKTGDVVIIETKYANVITGELVIGRKHSGKLVELIKEKSRRYIDSGIIVVDAAAGIGCPVISSIAGSDYLVIVIEPTDQALNTADKLVNIGKIFNVDIGIVVNKYDLNPDFLDSFEEWAKKRGVEILGMVPYDDVVVEAYVNMKSLVEYAPGSNVVSVLEDIAEKIFRRLGDLGD